MPVKRLPLIAFMLLFMMAATGPALADAIKTAVLTVPELCASNMHRAVGALEDLDGVEEVEADVGSGTITVKYVEYEADVPSMTHALEKAGLEVTDVVDGY